jgi:hypothetical protein
MLDHGQYGVVEGVVAVELGDASESGAGDEPHRLRVLLGGDRDDPLVAFAGRKADSLFEHRDDPLIAEGRSASNVGVTLLPLRAVYREAIEEGIVAVNPTAGLKLPRVRSRRDRIAMPDECVRLLAQLSAADRRIWATAMYAGLRRAS